MAEVFGVMKIVIPGGSGQVGRVLARHFHSQGDMVTVLSRQPRPAPWRVVAWDGVTPGAWITDVAESDVCINLAGRSVNCRYTAANRRIVYESRIHSTRLLNQVIASLNPAPRLWINASTATIYRHALDRAMNEAGGELGGSEPGAPDTWNFSIDVAKGWEEAFFSHTHTAHAQGCHSKCTDSQPGSRRNIRCAFRLGSPWSRRTTRIGNAVRFVDS
jgi:uncharacterized protein